jgi:microcystin degradation protein MlrC
VDLRERGLEAAGLMRRMLQGGAGEVALVKLPFLPASTDQLIAPGTPYHALVQEGQQQLDAEVLNVSLCGGFPLADCAKLVGFSVVVTARRGARARAEAVARCAWPPASRARRAEILTALTPLAQAVDLAVQAGLQEGSTGEAGAAAGSEPASSSPTWPTTPAAAARAAPRCCRGPCWRRGHGARCSGCSATRCWCAGAPAGPGCSLRGRARPRGRARQPLRGPLVHEAEVLALSDGDFVGRKGLAQGMSQRMGPSARLAPGPGVQVVVISQRQQLLDPAQLDALQADLCQVRTLVVKSRGHFRAAFDDFAPPSRIIEVDCPARA